LTSKPAGSAARRLGPYEFIGRLGAGGMGEVYRARDTRLGREVAIKVLPPEVSADSDRLRRFEKEARAASSLNHPNIVTIYEIERIDSTSFIAMELIDGKTLRDVVSEGALPLRKLLGIATQIADGLARAHSAGIVHRDLKPENVMVTKDGLVKILDFGLAKLAHPGLEGGQEAEAPTVSAGTKPGIVMGTVGYMSPEQASGHPVDFRSDQFSFGSLLYEMATGMSPFRRATAAQTLAAIIQDEPEPVATVNPRVPTPLRWIIEQCLAKEPRDRYASTEDLTRDLARIRDHLSEVSSVEAISLTASRSRRRVGSAIAAVALFASLGGAFFLSRQTGNRPVPSFHRVTFRRGAVSAARFTSDGQTIVYSAAWEGNPSDVFSTRSGSLEGRSLGFPRAELLGLSSAADMALALPGSGAGYILARAPLGGGAARQLVENVEEADWAPDGKSLAVIRNVEGKYRLEFPVGKVLYEAGGILTHVRVSPEGGRIALIDHAKGNIGPGGSVVVVDSSGRRQTLAGGLKAVWGLAWFASGKEVWFSAHDGSTPYALNAVTLSGRQRVIARAPVNLNIQDISRQGSVLVTRGITTAETFGHLARDSGEGERNLTWMDRAEAQDLSPDGETILYREVGEGLRAGGTAYVRRGDGSFVGPLGDGAAMALSPDGKWVLATRGGPPPQHVVLPVGAGEPRVLPRGSVEINALTWYRFFADGRRILFMAAEPGRPRRCYAQDIAGGLPKPVTPEGKVGCIVPSPDGKFVITRDAEMYPLEGGEPRPVPGLSRAERVLQWSADGKAIYVRNPDELPAKVYRVDLATGRRQLWKELAPSDPSGVDEIPLISITPDGKSYVYSYDRVLSDLYLVEGLK
jgi:eukaryotic-like serine/threonine-protein kinase